MINRFLRACPLLVAVMIVLCLPALAHSSVSEDGAAVKLLVVDATKTFASTARVGALAGAIRASGLFELAIQFSDETCPYGDPLTCRADLPDEPYEAIVIIPRGIDDRSTDHVWITTNLLPWTSPSGWPVIQALEAMIDQVFAGLARATDPRQDLWPALTSSLYQMQGWLR